MSDNTRKRAYKRWRHDDILALLREYGPMTVGQMAKFILDVSPTTIRFHCRKLEASGAVTSRAETVEERDARKAADRAHPNSPRQFVYSLA